MKARHRLHQRIFRSLLGAALIAVLATALLAHALHAERFRRNLVGRLAAEASLVAEHLAPRERSSEELQRILHRDAKILDLDIGVYGERGWLAATSDGLPVPSASAVHGPLAHVPIFGRPSTVVVLADGRRLVVRPRHTAARGVGFVAMLAFLVGVLVIGSRVAARRITRRLEALESGVRDLGSGVLSARVRVEGDDEVASLARRFNWAAERIERLVDSQRRVLASASHEFRSPLARLRMALELIREEVVRPEKRRRIDESVADIAELDALVEDLLLAERLTVGKKESWEAVDLASLVESEARGVHAQTEIAPAIVNGEARLLRRLVRNLVENAKRHAGGADVTIGVGMDPERKQAQIWIADRGPGVPEDERERIFEPFYRSRRHAEGEDGGVGLGLALVRQIARHHGGDVACEARDGGGTLFRVRLRANPE